MVHSQTTLRVRAFAPSLPETFCPLFPCTLSKLAMCIRRCRAFTAFNSYHLVYVAVVGCLHFLRSYHAPALCHTISGLSTPNAMEYYAHCLSTQMSCSYATASKLQSVSFCPSCGGRFLRYRPPQPISISSASTVLPVYCTARAVHPQGLRAGVHANTIALSCSCLEFLLPFFRKKRIASDA